MAAKWQQWMPLHVDRFKGSSAVQAMHPAARIGYLYLIATQWQSEDGSISSDPFDLAEDSGLGDILWTEYAVRILRNFSTLENGRLRNEVCYQEWLEAKRIFEARQGAAKRTNNLRPQTIELAPQDDRDKARKAITTLINRGILQPAADFPCVDCGHIGPDTPHDWDHYLGYDLTHYTAVQSVCRQCHHKRETQRGKHWTSSQTDTVTVSVTDNPPLRSADTITLTRTLTNTEEQQQKQKPSRAKSTSVKKGEKVPDERHQACKLAIQEYWNSKNPEIEVPWDGSEGKVLGMFLSANPKLTYVGVRRLLAHRENSEVNHSDRPSRWIRSLTSFNQGPIDRFGHPLGLNGGKHAAISQGRGQKNVGVLEEFINDTERRSDANQNGNIPAGDHRQSDAETLHGVSGGSRPQSLPGRDAESIDF